MCAIDRFARSTDHVRAAGGLIALSICFRLGLGFRIRLELGLGLRFEVRLPFAFVILLDRPVAQNRSNAHNKYIPFPCTHCAM